LPAGVIKTAPPQIEMPFNSNLLSKIIDGSAVAAFVINKEHKVIHWNTALEALSGLKREEVIGTSDHYKSFYTEKRPAMADLIVDGASPEEIEAYYPGKYRKSALIEGAGEAEDFFPSLGKHGRWLNFTASPIRDDNGEIIGAIETLIDITDRKNLENNLRYYSQQMTKAQEEDRRYLARELHDDAVQILGSLSRRLDNYLRKKHGVRSSEIDDLREIQGLLNHGLQSMNQFIRSLRPALLDDLGLIPALRSLTNNLEETDGILTHFTLNGTERRLRSDIELSLFRIVQEALNNIRKHSQATEATVTAEFTDSNIKLTVTDNGRGFSLNGSLDDLPRDGKLGLMGMKERAWLIGGTIEIDTRPGRGTRLMLTLPYPKQEMKSIK
jgi:signal transduction histidine kinase